MDDFEFTAVTAEAEGVITETLPDTQEENSAKVYTEKELNAEADRRVSKALETFEKNRLPVLLAKAKEEAERMANMTAEERVELEARQREQEYSKRLDDVSRRELKIKAHEMLRERGMDICLLEVLNYCDEESVARSLTAVESAVRNGIEARVNERLRGAAPKVGGPAQRAFTFEQLKNMSRNTIAENMEAVERALGNFH